MPCFPNFWRRLRSLFRVGTREGSEGEEIGEPLSPGLRRMLTVIADPPQIIVDLAAELGDLAVNQAIVLRIYAAELGKETNGAIGWTQESLEPERRFLASRTREELIRNYEACVQNILKYRPQDAPVPGNPGSSQIVSLL